MIGPLVIAGPRFCLVPQALATELCFSFSSGEPERSSYDKHYHDRDGCSVIGRHKVFGSMEHKAVSEKDARSSQHKAASHNFRFSRFVGLF